MIAVSTKKQCLGVIKNPKDPRRGDACSRWAVNGSDYCAVHGGSVKLGLASPEDLKNRCVAHSSRTGERCKKPAIAGGTVCRTHGGSAKHVQKKARELLDRAVEPALHQLRDIMLKPGTSDSDRLRAIQMLLDRSGFGPGITVEHEVKPWEATMQHVFKQSDGLTISREVPAYLRAELDGLPSQQSIDDIEDAVIVEDEEPENVVRLRPAYSVNDRATVRGSAEPPRRKR